MMKANKQIGFIYKNEESIDKILKDGDVVFERGFLREKTSTTLPINFGGVGKDLKDYKVYGNTKQQILPDGYTQVDYIESSGTQYIDTGFKPNQDTSVDIDIEITQLTNSNQSPFGARTTSTSNNYSVMIGGTAHDTFYNGWNTNAYNTNNLTIVEQKYNIYKNKNMLYLDGNLIDERTYATFAPDLNMSLFAINQNGTVAYFTRAKLYNCKIYDNNVLVRDFIPCYRNSDNEVGLYDLVNNVFYTNQGTGVFTYRSVAPTPDAPIEMVSCGDLITDTTDVNYGKYKIPVNVRSDNFFSPEYAVETQYFIGGGVSTSRFYTLENNKIIMEYPNVGGARYLNKIKLSAGTYYLKAKLSQIGEHTTSIFRYAIRDFTNNVAIVSSTSETVTNDFSLSFTILEELDISIMLIPNNTSDGTLLIENVMLSKIDEPYQPYYNETTNIYLDEPLRKIDEYSDYIDFVNQKVYRQLGELITNDYSDFNHNGTRDEYMMFLTPTINNLKLNISNISTSNIMFCNYTSQLRGSTASSKIRFNIPHEYLGTTPSSTPAEARIALTNLMSGKTMVFNYPLETPTEESITLPNIPTVDGNNTLNIETEITPSQVYIKYKSNE